MPELLFHNLTLGYERHPAVHHLSGAVEKGALVAVVGFLLLVLAVVLR